MTLFQRRAFNQYTYDVKGMAPRKSSPLWPWLAAAVILVALPMMASYLEHINTQREALIPVADRQLTSLGCPEKVTGDTDLLLLTVDTKFLGEQYPKLKVLVCSRFNADPDYVQMHVRR